MITPEDWVGRRNGKLTVLQEELGTAGVRARLKVRCDCGTEKLILRKNFAATKSCGTADCRHGTVQERLEQSSIPEPNSGCWLWFEATLVGYGVMSINNKQQKAHRVSYEVFKGPIPAGLFVCHRCDNPCCINPDHLFLGTPADNRADCCAKNRQARVGRPSRGTLNPKAKLTEANVIAIRSAVGIKQSVLAERFGVSQAQVSLIRCGGGWKHI